MAPTRVGPPSLHPLRLGRSRPAGPETPRLPCGARPRKPRLLHNRDDVRAGDSRGAGPGRRPRRERGGARRAARLPCPCTAASCGSPRGCARTPSKAARRGAGPGLSRDPPRRGLAGLAGTRPRLLRRLAGPTKRVQNDWGACPLLVRGWAWGGSQTPAPQRRRPRLASEGRDCGAPRPRAVPLTSGGPGAKEPPGRHLGALRGVLLEMSSWCC